jgi:hypothetical protein
MNSHYCYVDKFSLIYFFRFCIHKVALSALISKTEYTIYYIDATFLSVNILIPFLRIFNIRINKLNFEMRHIVDDNGELEREKVVRKDLFILREKIIFSKEYINIVNPSWKKNRLQDSINKGLVYDGIINATSAGRFVFLIKVVNWHMKSLGVLSSTFYVENWPWIDSYRSIAVEHGIKIITFRNLLSDIFNINIIRDIVRKFPRLYIHARNFKVAFRRHLRSKERQNTYKVFVEGRGDLNLKNDGYHSDFFWMINSDLSPSNVLYEVHNEVEMKELSEYGVNTSEGFVSSHQLYLRDYKWPAIYKVNGNNKELKSITRIIDLYNSRKIHWLSFFHDHKIKIFLTWDRVGDHHMVAADALDENNGISVYWPLSFDGVKSIGIQVCTDIIFSFSKFGADIEKQSGSKSKYKIIIGYPKDYAGELLKDEATKLRKKLKSHGAEKIVFAIDENSVSDSRWHTGHELQRENYSYILEKVLSTPWLGVIFKPKHPKNLRERLGDEVSQLLSKAEETGRCFVYKGSGRHTTSAPPVIAGLSCDVAIHGHLNAGTAGLECALQGIPTILIDREGSPKNKLYELPQGKVIFKSWEESIDAVMEHFSKPQGTDGFGDWSSIIDDLDPFRDGRAAYRMGTYLNWLIQGYEKGLSKEVIMENAAKKYRDEWGSDKVITE